VLQFSAINIRLTLNT